VLGVSELVRLGLVAATGRVVEAQRLGLLSFQAIPCGPALGYGVDALLDLLAHDSRLVPGLCERHVRVSTQAHVPALAAYGRSQDPRACT